MTRYKIVFEDGGYTSVCLDYEPQVGEIYPGGLIPRIIETVEVIS